jgi:hypothetical protein
MKEDFNFDFPFEINYEKVFKTNDILLMAEMLAKAEGVETECIEDVYKHLNSFITLAAVASLERKKLIIADYDVMSFGEEFAHSTIAKRKPNV